MEKDYSYQKQWEDYYKKENSFHESFILSFTFMILLMIIGYLLPSGFDWIFGVGFIIALAYATVVRQRYFSWKCPRCKTKFWNKKWFSYSVADKCRNCGLLKNEGSSFKLNY